MPTQVRIFAMPKSLGETLAGSSPTSVPRSMPELPNGISKGSYPRAEKPPPSNMGDSPKTGGITFAGQDKLPKLPIPPLDHTCKKYLAALKPLQGPREHAETRHAVHEFLKHDGPELQEKLQQYAVGKSSYIEQFCEFVTVTMIARTGKLICT